MSDVNVISRIVAIREAIEAGDVGYAYAVASDLEHDLVGLDDFWLIPCDCDGSCDGVDACPHPRVRLDDLERGWTEGDA